MPWGAAIGAIGAIGGGMLGSSASKKAAAQQAEQSNLAREFQQQAMDRARADQRPFWQSGVAANQTLADLLGPNGEFNRNLEVDATSDPGYEFGMRQGEKGMLRQMSARGVRMAPASMMALNRYNQDYAGTKYGEAFQRAMAQRQSRFGMLSDLANRGQSAASGMAQSGQAGASSMAGIMQGLGNSQAAGTMGAANAWGGALNDATKYGIDAYLRYQDANKQSGTGGV